MALTATIACNPTSTVTEKPVTAVLTISNSLSYPINLKAISPYVLPHGLSNYTINTGVSIGSINFGPNANITVPATGTDLVITFPVTFHAPSTGVLSSGSDVFDVGATCYSELGDVFAPTATTIEVDYAVTYPASQQ